MSLPRLVFWWNHACRSVMPLFRELALRAPGGVRVVVREPLGASRRALGWTPDPAGAAQLDVLPAHGWRTVVDRILAEEARSLHAFGGYQRSPVHAYAIARAIRLGIAFGLKAEAPLNRSRGLAGVLKALYLRAWVPLQTRRIRDHARFFVCLSGTRTAALQRAGWPPSVIHPFGYFPAPQGVRARALVPAGEPLRILSTGALEWSKGGHVLVEALAVSRSMGLEACCDIVGDGPQRRGLERRVRRLGLAPHVRCHGVVPDAALLALLSASDVLACPGLREPWALRVMDGLHCGLAVVVSDGIGASDLVAAHGAGLLVGRGDVGELARALHGLGTQPARLAALKQAAWDLGARVRPSAAAEHYLAQMRHVVDGEPVAPPPWAAPAGA